MLVINLLGVRFYRGNSTCDHVRLPAHPPYRVTWTAEDEPTIRLAIPFCYLWFLHRRLACVSIARPIAEGLEAGPSLNLLDAS